MKIFKEVSKEEFAKIDKNKLEHFAITDSEERKRFFVEFGESILCPKCKSKMIARSDKRKTKSRVRGYDCLECGACAYIPKGELIR